MVYFGFPGNPSRLSPTAACIVVLLALRSGTNGMPSAEAAPPDRKSVEFFESRIRPVLVSKCYACHSQDAAKEKKLKGKLLLDSKAGVLAGGESGPAIVPGKPEESLLIEAIRHDSLEMPPNERLNENIISNFVKWIEMGAPDPRDGRKVDLRVVDLQAGRQHWAFRPLCDFPLPKVRDEDWIRTSLDRFVLAKLQHQKMTPTEEADRRTLIRRVYFDLIGLPPSPREVKQFIEDPSTTAYEDLIERLLKSEHYGERWARHWLDVARFGESDGSDLRENKLRPDAWKYRDSVIKSFNEDLPYNEFVAY